MIQERKMDRKRNANLEMDFFQTVERIRMVRILS